MSNPFAEIQPHRPGILFLSEDDVCHLLTMEIAIEAVEEGLRLLALNQAQNIPRSRIQTDHSILHTMAACIPTLNAMGSKIYTTPKKGSANFLVSLFEETTGKLLALIQADHLGRIRTGAASAIATQWMAREDATLVGLYGTGRQARTQLLGVTRVRNIRRIHVYSPNPEHRRDFCVRMTEECQTEVMPVEHPEQASEGMDIIITATSSREPLLKGNWIRPGTHINAIGSNFRTKAELDSAAIRRCHCVVVDSKDQARIEAGDLIRSEPEDSFHWNEVHELGQIITGQFPARRNVSDVTLFKSLGIAIEDVAVASRLNRLARENGIGQIIDW